MEIKEIFILAVALAIVVGQYWLLFGFYGFWVGLLLYLVIGVIYTTFGEGWTSLPLTVIYMFLWPMLNAGQIMYWVSGGF